MSSVTGDVSFEMDFGEPSFEWWAYRGPTAQVPQKVCRTYSSGLAGVTYRPKPGLSS